MKRFTFGMVALAVMALVGAAWAGKDREEPCLRVKLDLADGSRVIGVPAIESVPLQTPYAKMELPLKQTLTVTIGEDHETASVEMRNGDELKGVVNLEPIKLETVFGKVAIGIEHITVLRVVMFDGALPESLSKGLALLYSFGRDEGGKVTDQSGGGHAGQVHGATFAPEGGAYVFDGNGFIEIDGNAADFRKTTEDSFSISVWVNLANPTTGAGNPVFSASNDYADRSEGGKFVYALSILPDGKPQFGLGKVWRCGLGGANGASPLSANAWHHLVAVHSNQTGCIYVDGEFNGSFRYQESLGAPVNTPILLGRAVGQQPTNFNGKIGETRFYNRALSPDDVKQLYNARK